MKRFVPSKTDLALECGVSRQTIYAALRIHGAPKPRKDGMYSVVEMRRFLSRIRRDVPNIEKDQLQTTLLSLKIKRAERELVDFEERLREEIAEECRAQFIAAVKTLAGRLKLLPRDVAMRCDGATASQICKVATELLYKCFDVARRDFGAHAPEKEQEPSKVIPFGEAQAARANG